MTGAAAAERRSAIAIVIAARRAGAQFTVEKTTPNLGIDRTQIIEITDKKIIVQDLSAKVPAHAAVPA